MMKRCSKLPEDLFLLTDCFFKVKEFQNTYMQKWVSGTTPYPQEELEGILREDSKQYLLQCSNYTSQRNVKAKQPESGDLCGNITEFGVAEGSPEPAG